MIDCLLIGMNGQRFPDYLDMVRSMGPDAGSFRDLNLSFIQYDGQPYQSMDLLSRLHARNGATRPTPFHNADFLWPTITYLGTYLSRQGLSFDYVNAFQYEKDELRDKLTSEEILIVAITTTLYVVPWPIQEIIGFIRACNTRTQIVVGGPYIANVAKGGDRAGVEDQLRALGADFYVISSEGEVALTSLIKTLKAEGDLDKVANLAYRDGNRLVFTGTSFERSSLVDNLVDYSLFSRDRIGQFVSTRTAKSCPFACAFCNFPQQAGDYTYMPVGAIERELNAIRDIGTVTTVTFIDDTFNVPKKRFVALLEMMIRNEYHRHFKWNCTLRSDHCNDEIFSLMAKSGCEGVFLQIESGSDRMLAAMKKTARRKDYLWAIPRLKEEGILAHANIFIGFPGETLDTVAETLDLIQQTRPETFSAQPWYANPLTPVWNKREEYQIRGSSFKWSHRTMDTAQACDLVDRIFLTVDESTFLPQFGFFQWSLFYLQRHGMPLAGIKRYLNAFNALVREKIVGHADEAVHARLVAELEASANFAAATSEASAISSAYSGAARREAETYWITAFSALDHKANGRAIENSLDAVPDWSAPIDVALPPLPDAALLAAYAILAWRLDELQPALLLVLAPELVPLALRPESSSSFEAWTRVVEAELKTARRHRLHAFDILSGRSSLVPFHAARPRLRCAFSFGDDDASGHGSILADDLLMQASVATRGGARHLQLSARCNPGKALGLANLLEGILAEVADRPHTTIEELAGEGVAPLPQILALHREETFEF